jgi:hypothetical protein
LYPPAGIGTRGREGGLKPTSPCRKKASDGGDIGCRYTPEMMEVLEKALELRKKGIVKF